MTTATVEATGALLEVYKRTGPVFVGGEGCRLTAEDGTRYLRTIALYNGEAWPGLPELMVSNSDVRG